MALSLESNDSYSLVTKENDHRNKEVIFVKLTDSCVKAIDEYLQFKAATDLRPSICFDGSNGSIIIPSKGASANKDVRKRFNFSCSSLVQTGERQGVLECLQQPLSSKKALLSLGALQKKLNVMATEDVYEMTRTRMAQVDKEKKEVRTKEIRINHVKNGAKKSHVIPPVNAKLLALSNKKKPVVNNSAPSNGVHPSSPNSLKEKMIHVLALRPFRKGEILARLQRDGLSPKDSSLVHNLLDQVATLQDNAYRLHRRFYNDIQPDQWPYYNERERQMVKRIISQMKGQDASPTVSSTTRSPEERGLLKRPANEPTTVPAKKPRPTTSPKDIQNNNTTSPSEFQTDVKVKDVKKTLKADLKIIIPPGKKSPIPSQEDSQSHSQKESPPIVASTSKSPDYLSKYKPITSYEQRCRYKQDFQAEYGEYIKLKETIDSISKKFMELDRSWKRCERDSPEAKKIQEEIYNLYEEHQKDDKYQEMKKRYQELHEKLSHIKQLVVTYDKTAIDQGTRER